MTQPDLARLEGLVEQMSEHLPWCVVEHEYEAKEWATVRHRTIMTAHDHPQMKGPLPVVCLGSGSPPERGGMMVPIVWLTAETAEAIVGIMNSAPALLARVRELQGVMAEQTDLVDRLCSAVERAEQDIGGEGALTVLGLLGPANDRARAALNLKKEPTDAG